MHSWILWAGIGQRGHWPWFSRSFWPIWHRILACPRDNFFLDLTLTFKAIWPFRLTKRHSTSLLYTALGRQRCATRPKRALVRLCRHRSGNDMVSIWYKIIVWTLFRNPYSLSHGDILAATRQLYKWYFPSVCLSVRLSVCPSVTPFWLCSHHRIIINFQELLPMNKVRSMQNVKVRGQRSRSQRSQPNLTVSGL